MQETHDPLTCLRSSSTVLLLAHGVGALNRVLVRHRIYVGISDELDNFQLSRRDLREHCSSVLLAARYGYVRSVNLVIVRGPMERVIFSGDHLISNVNGRTFRVRHYRVQIMNRVVVVSVAYSLVNVYDRDCVCDSGNPFLTQEFCQDGSRITLTVVYPVSIIVLRSPRIAH